MAPPRRREYHVNPKSIPRARHASLSLERWTAGEVEIRGTTVLSDSESHTPTGLPTDPL